MRTFPPAAQINVRSRPAASFLDAVARLPPCDDAALRGAEVQAALRSQLRASCPDDFPRLVEEIHLRLARAPFCALVRGLRFDGRGLLFVAITSAFGDMVEPSRQSQAAFVRPIRPATDRKEYGYGALNEQLHTDSTDWPNPNDFTCLLCERPDQNGGGETRLLDQDELLRGLRAEYGPEVIESLRREPAPWRLADELGGGVAWSPVVSGQGIRYMKYTIDLTLEEQSVRLSRELSSALEAVSHTTRTSEGVTGLALEADDLLLINNKRCLHARTAIPSPEQSRRLLWRVKVTRRGGASDGRRGEE